jgi:glycosyltransferase involved in cell wall biosynthesis
MRILHYVEGRCNPDTANGVDKTIYFLCREQARLGNEVHLISTTDKELVPLEGVTMHRIRPIRSPFSRPAAVSRLLDDLGPHVIHLHSAYVPGNVVLARMARARRIPYVVTPNGNCSATLLRRRPWLKIPYKYLLERPMMNRSAFVHSVGDTAQISGYGVTVPVVVGLNGMDLSCIPGDLDPRWIVRRYPEWVGRCVFVYIGRLDIEQKGLDLLLQAFAGLQSEHSGAALLLVGPEWQGSISRLEAMIGELGLDGAVKFHGPAFGQEKFELLRAADVFVHASRWEGLPFAVVEAMAVGAACVVTRAADPAGLLEANHAGIVSEISTSGFRAALAEALAAGPDTRAALGRSARGVVEREMRWDHSAALVCEGYRKHCIGAAG